MNLILYLKGVLANIAGKISLACCYADVFLTFATLETRTLGRVDLRKDFWDCYLKRGKKLANN